MRTNSSPDKPFVKCNQFLRLDRAEQVFIGTIQAAFDKLQKRARVPVSVQPEFFLEGVLRKQRFHPGRDGVEAGVIARAAKPVSGIPEIALAAVDEIMKQVVIPFPLVRLGDFVRGVPVIVPEQQKTRRHGRGVGTVCAESVR
jgi:hypothetical protein